MQFQTFDIQYTNGSAAPGVSVMVYLANTVTPATVYDENGNELMLPLVSGVRGQVAFAAASGDYDLRATVNGVEITVENVQFFDRDSVSFRGFTTRAAAEAGDTGTGNRLSVGDLDYVYDASGTALTTGDSRTWSPVGDATPSHWGAVADGTTDNSTEFQAMIDWCLSADSDDRVIRLDKATYSLSSEVVATWDSGGTTLSILGHGSHETVINVRNTSGAFDFDMSDLGIHKLNFQGVSFVAKAASDASITRCIRVTGAGTNSARYDTVRMHDMTIEVDRENLLGSVFLTGIDLQESIRPRLTYIFGWGRFGPGSGESDWNLMEVFVNMFDCYGPFLQHVRAWSCHTGFKQETTVAEGGQFEHVGTGGNNAYGVVLLGNNRTMGNFFECYFDSNEGAITATNVNDIRITETLFWCSNNYVPSPAERYDIKLINCQRAILNDTVHRFEFAAVTNSGILLDGDCEDITIRNANISSRDVGIQDAGTNNRIIEPYFFDGDVGVELTSTASGTFVDRPDGDSATTLVDQDASASGITINPAKSYRARVGLTSAQSIANASNVTVSWSEQQVEVGGNWVTVPSTTVTIPAGYGIRRVRITLQTKWGNNSVGLRESWITKNNSSVDGMPRNVIPANGLSHGNISGIVECTDGDVFRVLVKQDAGSAQSLGPDDVWMTIEAVQ